MCPLFFMHSLFCLACASAQGAMRWEFLLGIRAPVDLLHHSLLLSQAGQKPSLAGEDTVVGNLVEQLLACTRRKESLPSLSHAAEPGGWCWSGRCWLSPIYLKAVAGGACVCGALSLCMQNPDQAGEVPAAAVQQNSVSPIAACELQPTEGGLHFKSD